MDGRGKRTVNANDVYERTPLHLAAQEGHDELVEFFLKKGAKIDRLEQTALITPLCFTDSKQVIPFSNNPTLVSFRLFFYDCCMSKIVSLS